VQALIGQALIDQALIGPIGRGQVDAQALHKQGLHDPVQGIGMKITLLELAFRPTPLREHSFYMTSTAGRCMAARFRFLGSACKQKIGERKSRLAAGLAND
jgi:hypothetical protein